MSFFRKIDLIAILLVFGVSLFAGSELDSRVRELEKQMTQVRTGNPSRTFGANTASARPDIQATGFFLSFDVLYWQAKAGGTEYCYTDGVANGALPERGTVYEGNPGWNWGLRAGIGYNFEHGHWDIYANYTYFSSHHNTMKTSALNGSIMPLKGGSSVFQYTAAGKATSQFKFCFNRLDLELGRDFFVAEFLSFRPHFGLMGAWMDIQQTLHYSGGNTIGNNYVYVKDTSDLSGIGPRVGANSKWYLGCGFSFFGNASGALAYSNIEVRHKENYSLNTLNNSIHLNGDFHRFVPTAQLQLGLALDRFVLEDTQHITLSLGWDIEYFWRANQFLTTAYPNLNSTHGPTYERASEDVSLQGVTLQFLWAF